MYNIHKTANNPLSAITKWRKNRLLGFFTKATHPHLPPELFPLSDSNHIDTLFEYYNLQYHTSQRSRQNIPANGRIIIVIEGVTTPLQALAILHLVREIRRDIKLVADENLHYLHPLQELVLPINERADKFTRWQNLKRIMSALRQGEAIIFCLPKPLKRNKPRSTYVFDSLFIRMAEKTGASLLPVLLSLNYFNSNTITWNITSLPFQPEPRNNLIHPKPAYQLEITIGEPIPIAQIMNLPLTRRKKSERVRKHLLFVAKHKKPIFSTEKTIVHPQDRRLLRYELYNSELLGETADGNKIFLFKYSPGSAVMQEIGRLREFTFRHVGEGTGKTVDIDRHDSYYHHIVLWNENSVEITGAYRLCHVQTDNQKPVLANLYSAGLFTFNESVFPYLNQAIELGRSFVHPDYWGKRSLDYLWYGIGAYLKLNPEIRYLFGPVSISNHYPEIAKDMLVFYYQNHYGDHEMLAFSNTPYHINDNNLKNLQKLFKDNNARHNFVILKDQLNSMSLKVPTLYKQYSELCKPGGARFLAFGVDPGFNYCVDGLVLVDLHAITEKKRMRYIGR